jgi:hypothetical protein
MFVGFRLELDRLVTAMFVLQVGSLANKDQGGNRPGWEGELGE